MSKITNRLGLALFPLFISGLVVWLVLTTPEVRGIVGFILLLLLFFMLYIYFLMAIFNSKDTK